MSVLQRTESELQMGRRLPGKLLLWFAVIGAVTTGYTEASAKSERPPNIVLILADDLGWADLGCYGADLHETPHLDRIARDGMRFTNAYASAPICSPTRAAIMTGQYPARLHLTIWREAAKRPVNDQKMIPPQVEENLPRNIPVLPELIQRADFGTGHIGKWHLGDSSHYPEAFGFDFHLGGNHWGAPASYFFPYRGAFSRGKEHEKEQRYVPGLHWGQKGEYLTDRLTDEAVKFIEQSRGRFFLNLWHYGVHTPMEAKADDVMHFKRKVAPGMNHRNETYAAMLRSLDQSVGRIMAALKDRRLAENTLVIFTSDNGGFLGGPDRFITTNTPLRSGKGSLYEGGIRVPLILYWPGIVPEGTVCDEPVASMDLYPTLLDVCALSSFLHDDNQLEAERRELRALWQQEGINPDGVSLLPVLIDPTAKLGRESLYWHYPHYYPTSTPSSSIRKNGFKLIEFHEDQHVELYNINGDLSETTDLVGKMPEMAKELREELHNWRQSVNAQMPTVNAAYKAK